MLLLCCVLLIFEQFLLLNEGLHRLCNCKAFALDLVTSENVIYYSRALSQHLLSEMCRLGKKEKLNTSL